MDLEYIIDVVLWLMAVLLSLTVHEFAHAKYADWAGDPTPRRQGRVTLNPIAHLDPLGTLLIIMVALSGFGFGWGKPVEVNPGYFRNPRRDWVLCAFVGPLSNILLAVLFALILRLAPIPDPESLFNNIFLLFALYMVITNVGLAVFNMLPIHPLDGSKVLSGFLPDVFDRAYWRWQLTYGPILLMAALVIVPVVTNGAVRPIAWVLAPVRDTLLKWLLA
ncbi:Zn-dependent protease (includes SpoIVFB) [Armatimonadetes bacterium GBS]|jgi:Zn-dependent protease|nr:MAG: peptidase [Fimbriimonadales bacterium]CUU08880.1 Zn-dependent protease (includes SpoIVFB) [Armatimonadetes bacterium GBS]CUU34935.1 Zn-dependent protease (includes SpoIVFB) [Armatimonadetes bacterium GXS]